MKTLTTFFFYCCLMITTACGGRPTASEPASLPEKPGHNAAAGLLGTISTSMGKLQIRSTFFVDEVNGVKAEPGKRILLVELTGKQGEKLEPAKFPLQDFQKLIQDSKGAVCVKGNDGVLYISTMAGWIGPDHAQFAIGFPVPLSVNSFQFNWPDNPPLPVTPGN